MTRKDSEKLFVPGMGWDWLLPLYDPLTKLLGLDPSRRTLLELAAVRPQERVLDVGCGTGSLAILIKQRHPEAVVVALDPDAKALARAGRKAKRAGVSIRFERGFADALPYPEAHFDHVFSSFMLHHLEQVEKQRMLREIRRVLKPGGGFHIVDFGGHASSRHHRLRDNEEHRVLALMTEAGLVDARNVGAHSLFAGLLPIAYYQASAPTSELARELADGEVAALQR